MKEFNVTFSEKNQNIKTEISSANESFNVISPNQVIQGTSDYEKLRNKPSINDVELVGNKTTSDLNIILRGTTEYWNSAPQLISTLNTVYIYTDYQVIDNGDGTVTIIPGIKVGDGTSYLIDMPFVASGDSETLDNHIKNETVHITQAEREFWNNKWRGYLNPADTENLVFTVN